ncbi:hypothetical protein [Streptomyces sp. NPDC018833]|uniref:hypothetical protein n=1 Tax=Streptomyces sp. NPDC018833 TaxID=3365053 RepID=UPI00379B5AD8
MTTKLTFDGDWHATVTGDPLHITPRFTGDSVDVMHCADVKERERFVLDTFGSQHFMWDFPDVFRFDQGQPAAGRGRIPNAVHVPLL